MYLRLYSEKAPNIGYALHPADLAFGTFGSASLRRTSHIRGTLDFIAGRRNGNNEDIHIRPVYYIYKTQPAYN